MEFITTETNHICANCGDPCRSYLGNACDPKMIACRKCAEKLLESLQLHFTKQCQECLELRKELDLEISNR